jgi:DNA repair exonuclease SbcCD ATPase subunit
MCCCVQDCNVPVYKQLEELCSSSLAGLAAMHKAAQQQIAEKDLELKKQQEECKARTKQLKEVEDRLWRRGLQLCKAQQQLQQQQEQLEAQEAELEELRQMRDTIMTIAQQVLPAMQHQGQLQP